MLHPVRFFMLGLVIGSLGFYSKAAAQLAPLEKNPAGTISGKVTIHGKGTAGIVIGLRAADPGSRPGLLVKVTSDEEGNYRFSGVASGRWLVIPFAPASVVASSSLNSFGSKGKMIVVAAGESVDGIDFTLVGGGVITGKVTDSDGRPLIEERLYLIPVDSTTPGVTAPLPDATRPPQTDDRGVYRAFGLAPGRYKVSVGQPEKSGVVMPTRRAYQQTFYPDTINPAKATVVEVTEGGEASQIDIVVGRSLKTFSATGQMVDAETGKPVVGKRWSLARLTENWNPNFYPTNSRSNNNGEFKMEGLLPGRYAVFVQSDQDAPAYSEPVQFEISDKDIAGLVIKTLPGATLSGKVVIEGIQDKAFFAKLTQMRLNVYVYAAASGFPSWHSAAINSDGSFQIRGLQPGTASINTVSSADASLVKNLLILHTERFGIEQTRGIEVKANELIEGLAVIVAYGTGIVRGEVKFDKSLLPPGSRVMVRVTRTDKVNPLTNTEVDARGRFQIERLPPGSYWLDLDVFLPAGRRGPPPMRQQVNVAGGVTEVTLSFDLNPTP
jgi:hypothetical protein